MTSAVAVVSGWQCDVTKGQKNFTSKMATSEPVREKGVHLVCSFHAFLK